MRLRRLFDGDGSAILYHLAQNPDDTAGRAADDHGARDKSERLRLAWLDRMRADGAILEADYESARAAVLGGGSASPPVLNAGSFAAWPNETPVIDADPQTAPPTTGPRVRSSRLSLPPCPSPPPRLRRPSPAVRPKPLRGTGRIRLAGRPGVRGPDTHPAPRTAAPARPLSEADGLSEADDTDRTTVGARRARPATSVPIGLPAARYSSGGETRGDVEYQVRRRLDDGRWQVVAHTKDTFIEDGEAPPGAVCVYAVSANQGVSAHPKPTPARRGRAIESPTQRRTEHRGDPSLSDHLH